MGFSHGPDHVQKDMNVLTNHDRNSTLSSCRKEMNPGIADYIRQDVHVVEGNKSASSLKKKMVYISRKLVGSCFS